MTSARLATEDSRDPLRMGAATVFAQLAAVYAIDGDGCVVRHVLPVSVA